MILALSTHAAVEFPGRPPGSARAAFTNGVLSLQNNVIAASWSVRDGVPMPLELRNKIAGARHSQRGTELFRVATNSTDGLYVAVRLDAAKVTALASVGGSSWTELASFPRAEFLGEPRIVRVGKMNLQAQAKDHDGPAGDTGECFIAELKPKPASWSSDRVTFKAAANRAAATEFPFPRGTAQVSCRIDKGSDQAESWSPALAVVWDEGTRFLLVGVRDKKPVFNVTSASGEKIMAAELGNGAQFSLASSSFSLDGAPVLGAADLPTNPVRRADSIPGATLSARLVSASGVRVEWRAELRDGSSYIRQTFAFSGRERSVPLHGVELVDARVPGATVMGSCPGSPVAGAGMFLGIEMPGARPTVIADTVCINVNCRLEVSPQQTYSFATVTGVAPTNQLRRAFLYYIERERARPSAPFLHYNCWYDLGYSVNEKGMLDVIASFDKELWKKRGVKLDSYVIDDGWDDAAKAPWEPRQDIFPKGFASLKETLDRAGSHLGMWISPLGGYGGAPERTAYFRRRGLVTNELDLAEPGYHTWFRDHCLKLMRDSGVNYFKWDKAGEGVSPHFMALLDVARALRAVNAKVMLNVTVGTWPSPFWLNHVDCTWRNGSADVGWTGKGDEREQWLTFRDGYCRKMFVEVAPLYPLNAVMHHGIVHGRAFQGEKVGKAGPHLKNEARSYFGSGAMLQELYLTPSMMTSDAWDRVAEAAKWAQANADVLADAHWVGGDPLKLEVYGYAAWAARKGTLMLRNPNDTRQTIPLDAATVFELPAGAPRRYTLTAAYKDQRIRKIALKAGTRHTVELEPFEVLVFDATPIGAPSRTPN